MPSELGDERPAQQRVVLGQVIGAHGVRGALRIHLLGDSPDNLRDQTEVWLVREAGSKDSRRAAVRSAQPGRPGELRLALSGIETREQAEALRGTLIEAPSERLRALPDGEFYWHELIGCRVWSATGEEIGIVRGLMETGAHDVLVVEDASQQRLLLPAAGPLLRELDPANRRIVIEVIPGLLDAKL